MKELIDRAVKDRMKIIFVQREYDTKNAKAIAGGNKGSDQNNRSSFGRLV